MYQIFVPQGQRAPDLAMRLGIADLVRDCDVGLYYTDILASGPDGGAGLLIELGAATTYKPDARTWMPCSADPQRQLAAGRFWWGIPKEGLVPTSLARVSQVAGVPRILGDDNAWLLPNMVTLPHRFGIDDQGNEKRTVQKNWQALYDRMQWAFDITGAILRNDSEATDEDCRKCREYLAEVLSVNYRVNRELVLRLGLLTDENWFNLVAATLDRQQLLQIQEDLQKKRLASQQPG